jgi:lysophospholipase L1-like esterase
MDTACNILLLLCLLLCVYTVWSISHIEGFTSKLDMSDTRPVYLLGDSSVDNSEYVPTPIGQLVSRVYPHTVVLAKEEADIHDIREQTDRIPTDDSHQVKYIVLSVGANDIKEVYGRLPFFNTNHIRQTFAGYAMVASRIKDTHPTCKLYLVSCYYPKSKGFIKFKPILKKWNKMLRDFAPRIGAEIIDISNELLSRNDFTQSDIPSMQGGKLIAQAIVQKITQDDDDLSRQL